MAAASSTASQSAGTGMFNSCNTSARYMKCCVFTIMATAITLPSIRMSWLGVRFWPYLATSASSGRMVPALSSGTMVLLATPPI